MGREQVNYPVGSVRIVSGIHYRAKDSNTHCASASCNGKRRSIAWGTRGARSISRQTKDLQYLHYEGINTVLNEGELVGQPVGKINVTAFYVRPAVGYNRLSDLTGPGVCQFNPGAQG